MTNHCDNELRIVGKLGDLIQFRIKAEGYAPTWGAEPALKKMIPEDYEPEKQILCCNNFIPIPEKILKSFNDYGYDFCIKRWGSKWGAYHIETTHHIDHIVNSKKTKKSEILYYYNTAWNPICPVVLEMSKQFPSLKFTNKYWEAGNGYRGIFVCKAGKILKDKNYDYHGDRGG